MTQRMKSRLFRKLAIQGKNVTFGKNLHVGPFSRIWAPYLLTLGDNVYIGKFVTIECDGEIGNGVLIANAVGIVGRKDHDLHQIGVLIRESRWVGEDASLSSRVEIGCDVWIGYGAIVLAPVKIGNSAIVAAGAVVVKDVPEFAIVAGNPAEVIRLRFENDGDREEHKRLLYMRGVK